MRYLRLTPNSLADAASFMGDNDIEITGSFSFGNMSAIFVRDPDRNVIELDAYDETGDARGGYSGHP
jgi:hypothetical protein